MSILFKEGTKTLILQITDIYNLVKERDYYRICVAIEKYRKHWKITKQMYFFSCPSTGTYYTLDEGSKSHHCDRVHSSGVNRESHTACHSLYGISWNIFCYFSSQYQHHHFNKKLPSAPYTHVSVP